jgi:cupin fold WbuC family metalloprotein
MDEGSMVDFTKVSDEVLYSPGAITRVDRNAIRRLKEMAAENPRRRIRLCAHPDTADPLHEMLIVHMKDAYVPPHRHPGKSESFHIIEGSLTVVVFDDAGGVTEVIEMGEPGSGRVFYYRLSEARYHTVIVTSDVVAFHEVTNGPFRREDMEFAPWAPDDNEVPEAQLRYIRELLRRIG